MNADKKAIRIQVSAEEDRKNRAARIEFEHKQKLLDLEVKNKELLLKQKKQQDRDEKKWNSRYERQAARKKLARRIKALMPTIGRRVMIAGPILAPMAVAWIGQIGFAHNTLKWPLVGGIVFAAAWELTTAFSGWMYHQARRDGDRGLLFRVATWLFAASAGAMNYWHALDGAGIFNPTPKAVSYGAMSVVGIALWELYSSLIHRKHLRAEGIVSSARPRFGILRWVRFTRITWHAWSLSVRYGIRTVDAAWSEAVAEVERIDRVRALKRERRRLAKDRRPEVRVTVVRVVDHTVAPKPALRVYRVQSLGATNGRQALAPERGPRAISGQGHDGATKAEPQQSRANNTRATEGANHVLDGQGHPKVIVQGASIADRPDSGPAKKTNLVEFTPRGETQGVMRTHWDTRITDGVIPSGADLNRAAGKDPKYSLGKKYAKAWRQELPEEFVEAVEAGRTEEARQIAAGFGGAERKAVAQ